MPQLFKWVWKLWFFPRFYFSILNIFSLFGNWTSLVKKFRTGYGTFWKGLEIGNTIFQDLERFGKREVSIMAIEKDWIIVWESSKIG